MTSAKIASAERIERILLRVSKAEFTLIIRLPGDDNKGVRGTAKEVMTLNDDSRNVLKITNISNVGSKYLKKTKELLIEFVLVSTKISFHTTIASMDKESLYVYLPSEMQSIERRKVMRHEISKNFPCYLHLKGEATQADKYTSVPFLPNYQLLNNLTMVDNISLSGVCLITRFPSVIARIRDNRFGQGAQIYMPMQPAITFSFEAKWIRPGKGNEFSNDEGLFYRIGFAFIDPSFELSQAIKLYSQQLQTQGAI